MQDLGISILFRGTNFLRLLGCHTFQGCSCPFVHFPVIVKLLSFHGAPPFQISMNISVFTDIII